MRGDLKLRIDFEALIADNVITRGGNECKMKQPIKPFDPIKRVASRFFRTSARQSP
jgi:hypothetical protein